MTLADQQEFRDVIGRFASGVTVITTSVDGAPFGTTASAVSSLSLEPNGAPSTLVVMTVTPLANRPMTSRNSCWSASVTIPPPRSRRPRATRQRPRA